MRKMTVIYDGKTILSVNNKDESEYVFKDSSSDILTGTREDLKKMLMAIGIEDLSKFDEFEITHNTKQ